MERNDYDDQEPEEPENQDEQSDLLDLINHLHRLLHHRYFHRQHHGHGPFADPYRGQGRVLALLKMKPEISQKDLSYLTDIRPQSLGELLAKLENNGYITREPLEADRRVMMIRLTEKGADEQLPEPGGKEHAALFDCLEDDERDNLAEYLERVIAALRERLKESGFRDEGPEGHRPPHPHRHGRHGPHEPHGRDGEEDFDSPPHERHPHRSIRHFGGPGPHGERPPHRFERDFAPGCGRRHQSRERGGWAEEHGPEREVE